MQTYLLTVYEIAYRASKVTSRQMLVEFEAWVKDILRKYNDAAIERHANIHLFQLKNQFSY